ncbi:MAG: DUF4111 domain-containing protein [Erythrobacter sp.]|uniref:aminoglycoside adenylyltransferase domain-containing protein n=1 Tax=Erythrobacter sp. TaxID=1042 RepID=UPI002625170C|nr:aminoglycoside adenylyltransferase domain-containing protein [Erythrobacter sp.]MDJ0977238.1 DUF4111 domain-containing protein [Erythrobacter sp.]
MPPHFAASLPPIVEAYLDEITGRFEAILGAKLAGLYLHGSAVQGDYQPDRSDLDVFGLVSSPLSEIERDRLIAQLSHSTLPVPAVGLELTVCRSDVAQAPVLAYPLEFALSTGAIWGAQVEALGTCSDLVIHAELCRQQGRALVGPPPAECFAPTPRHRLRSAVIAELRWHQDNLSQKAAPLWDANAVLNAARSVYAADAGRIVSKTQGGERWLDRHPAEDLVAEALSRRSGARTEPLGKEEVRAFLDRSIALIERM